MRLVPSRKVIRRAIATLWVTVNVWLLIRTLLLRNASPQVFGDAEEIERLLVLGLSSPLSALVVWVAGKWISFAWWSYPGNDSRTILAIWIGLFVIGCFQWFVLVPWIVHKGFDLYDFVVVKIRGRFRRRI
jgi:hypothetical protein